MKGTLSLFDKHSFKPCPIKKPDNITNIQVRDTFVEEKKRQEIYGKVGE